MITEFFLSIPAFLLQALVKVLPAGGTVPQEWGDSVRLVFNYASQFNFFLPIDTLLSCLAIVFGYHVAVWAWDAIVWIISRIRG